MEAGTPKRPTLTEADLELVATPDEELRARCGVMSFDSDKMMSRIDGGAWHNVVQAHLYYDHIITATISENVPRPQVLNLDRLSFSQKLDLISALDLLEPEFISFLKKVNKVRNNISHDLDFELTDEYVTALINAVPASLRNLIEEDPYLGEGISLQKVLVITILLSDINRQRLAGDRITGQKSALRLRAVLDRVPHQYQK